MHQRFIFSAACAVLLAACADAEKSAEKALTTAQADWTDAQNNLDPKKRVDAYKKIIGDVERAGEKYKKTQAGQAIAAGRSAAGVSITAMKGEYERLADRASCYAKPTVDCLEPFASSGYKYQSANAGGAGNAAQIAAGLVCEKNFAAAENALEDLKINKPAYAASLTQVALAASGCEKPDAVKQAMSAYIAAEPSTGAQRVAALQSVVGEASLREAWPLLLPELEKAAEALPANQSAGVDLTLAARYAALGDAEKALAKFNHVTEELGYSVDTTTRINVAAALLAGGFGDAAYSLTVNQPNTDNLQITIIHYAIQELGGRLGVIRAAGVPNANVPVSGGLTDFFAPPSPDVKKRENEISDQIEAKLDQFVAARQPNGQYLGLGGADAAYGRLALIQQKLGDSAKANALIEKAERARQTMLPPGAYNPDAPSYAGEFEVLTAIGQGDPEKAASWLPRVTPAGNDVAKQVLIALARAGKAEEALTLASQINRADPNMYQTLINELGENGHVKEAEQVLKAFTGDASARSAIAWGLVEKAATAGKMKEAEKIAETYSLLDIPAYKLRMIELNADAAIAKKDRKKAETAIRDMFALGDEFDKMAAAERTSSQFAQNAARKAFSAGYIDLGVELYNAASNKDQKPFFDAFTENTNRGDFPKVLMLAHDNLRGEELGYVIDAAIRGLKG
ncbi:MAG TPA: hypothetical protein PKH09_04240 [Parvularculaceae bacterium]|nr:hypothetical protein [Parvularculaceae bacterium]